MKIIIKHLQEELKISHRRQKEDIKIDKEWDIERGKQNLNLSERWLKKDIRERKKYIAELTQAIRVLSLSSLQDNGSE